MRDSFKYASELHKNVPPDWYFSSIRRNLLQRYWHNRRFEEVGKIIEKTNGKILDIGSADGVFSRLILEKSGASEVDGIDVLESSVKWAKKHWKKNKKLIRSYGTY
jgi:2-polyprenyl-3-methyl-5-hydroxy-6-metoxy-1,4-benzoquinol methylase